MNNHNSYGQRVPFSSVYKALPSQMQLVISHIYHETDNADPRLILSAMFGFMSAVSQAGYNIELPHKVNAPLSLYLMTIAPSGAKKSTVHKYFIEIIQEYESKVRSLIEQKKAMEETNWVVWSEEKKSLKTKLKFAIKNEDDEDIIEFQVRLLNLHANKPLYSKPYQALYTDITKIGLLKGLASKNKNALIGTSEASMFIKELPRLCSDLNAIWSGENLSIERAKDEDCIKLDDARLTISAMVQNGSLQERLLSIQEAKDSGFFARLLINHIPADQFDISLPQYDLVECQRAWNHFARQGLKLIELSEKHYAEQNKRIVLQLTPEASEFIKGFTRDAKLRMSNGYYSDAEIRPFIDKLDNHISRLAVLISLFSDGTSSNKVDIVYVQSACKVMEYFLEEQVHFFALNGYAYLVAQLKNWFLKQQQKTGFYCFKKSYLLQNVTPHKLRKADVLDIVLTKLIEENFIYPQKFMNDNAMYFILTNSTQNSHNFSTVGRWGRPLI